MSIATAIQNAQQKVANAYTAVNQKGGTLPATQNLSNLPAAINSITTGITPTGTLSITANGVYDVTNYASANVSVASGGNTALLTVKIEFDSEFLEDDSYLSTLRSITFSINGTTYTYRNFYLVKIYPYYYVDEWLDGNMMLFIQVPMNTDLQWQATVVPGEDEEEFHPNDSGVLNISNDYTLNLRLS